METTSIDEVMRSAQNETEALREIIRQKELVIKALKSHSLCLRQSFKEILSAVLDRIADADVQFHARKMIEELDRGDEQKIGDL